MGEPLLRIDRVSVVHRGGLRAVDRVSLSLEAGETLSLIGESGSGKTTLARAVLDLVRPAEGSVLFAGRPVAHLRGRERKAFRRSVQMIFQDPAASLSPRFTMRRLLAEPLRIHGLTLGRHWPDVLDLLARVGLPESILDKYPHQLSGGQARRIAIARALALKPRLILADEPTAGLDLSVQGDLINLMADLQRAFGLTWFVISHDLNVVRAVSDRIAVMYLGRIAEQGPAELVLRRPAHPYTRALLAAVPRIDPERRHRREALPGEAPDPHAPPAGCVFHTRCPFADEHCRTVEPQERRLADGRSVACHKPLAGPDALRPVPSEAGGLFRSGVRRAP